MSEAITAGGPGGQTLNEVERPPLWTEFRDDTEGAALRAVVAVVDDWAVMLDEAEPDPDLLMARALVCGAIFVLVWPEPNELTAYRAWASAEIRRRQNRASTGATMVLPARARRGLENLIERWRSIASKDTSSRLLSGGLEILSGIQRLLRDAPRSRLDEGRRLAEQMANKFVVRVAGKMDGHPLRAGLSSFIAAHVDQRGSKRDWGQAGLRLVDFAEQLQGHCSECIAANLAAAVSFEITWGEYSKRILLFDLAQGRGAKSIVMDGDGRRHHDPRVRELAIIQTLTKDVDLVLGARGHDSFSLLGKVLYRLGLARYANPILGSVRAARRSTGDAHSTATAPAAPHASPALSQVCCLTRSGQGARAWIPTAQLCRDQGNVNGTSDSQRVSCVRDVASTKAAQAKEAATGAFSEGCWVTRPTNPAPRTYCRLDPSSAPSELESAIEAFRAVPGARVDRWIPVQPGDCLCTEPSIRSHCGRRRARSELTLSRSTRADRRAANAPRATAAASD
ncbi:MAG: hypothetical protein ACHREM_15940 [Polyangiales bacterium]